MTIKIQQELSDAVEAVLREIFIDFNSFWKRDKGLKSMI